ncbi:MAG: DUF349 domain-containing protein [Bacteroidales bacterium]|jgi:D-ribose pyranose/furanose isomerase RbsD|nr:DUF349 domain-containing protein [Bacteroidales bacterium]
MSTNENTPVQDEQVNTNESVENVEQNHDQEPVAEVTEATIENKSETSENEEQKETVDYNLLSEEEIVDALTKLISENSVQKIRKDVDEIKTAFYKKYRAGIDKAREEFVAEGNEEKDFAYPLLPLEKQLKEIIRTYRENLSAHELNIAEGKKKNLAAKNEIIEKIKELINSEETLNDTFNEFKTLKERWDNVGQVPQENVKALWESYHYTVQQFYDYIKINNELRDLDLKKNLEAKLQLCEKAEDLLLESNIIDAFKKLQKYHEAWREIGPVPHEQRNSIWERFSAATSQINKKHQDYFVGLKEEQKKNLEAKTLLCEQVEAEIEVAKNSHQQWTKASDKIIEIQKTWKTIGFAPKKSNTEIYQRFRAACDKFFESKKEFYQKSKQEHEENMKKKVTLCERAEALMNSEDWKKTTDQLINLQKEWKTVGPVSRKDSDNIWNRFRKACDTFFNRKEEHFANIDSVYEKNLEEKKALIEEIKAFTISDDMQDSLAKLKEFQRRWSEIGFVPMKNKDEIQQLYRESINAHFDSLNLNEDKRNTLKFKNKIEDLMQGGNSDIKIRQEREKHYNRLKKLENDIVVLENNIGFFSNSKNAESLIKDVKVKIDRARRDINDLKKKIRMIDSMNK